VVEAVVLAVIKSALRPEGGPAFLYCFDTLLKISDIEEGIILASEGVTRQVLGGSGRADRDEFRMKSFVLMLYLIPQGVCYWSVDNGLSKIR
jgi:hypothetical protein